MPGYRLVALAVSTALATVVSGFTRTGHAAPAFVTSAAGSIPAQSDQVFSRDWKRLKSENFVAVGNADYVSMRSVLTELEGFRQALLRSSPALRLAPMVPTTVVVFKDEAAFSRFRPLDTAGHRRESVAGYFLSGGDANYLVVPMHNPPSRTFQYLFHEYTHFIVRQNLGDVPAWLNEGLAELYSTFRATPRDGRSILGEPPHVRLVRLARGPWLPLRDVLTMNPDAQGRQDPPRTLQFYAQAWLLVHYLTLGPDGTHPERIGTYLATLRKGASVENAVQAGFGRPVEALEQELARYVRGRLPHRVIDEPETGVRLRTSQEAMLDEDVADLQRTLLQRLARQ